ncbi:uncharacterized protein LOC119725508 [Patiria miniata]|uniref:Uncharacterized protein n=1 Tax=Patiria miniata TaxID=46514 RepID=A0A913ZM25_PATMI|nr:uncharacterized protein LOC119725508 [Patiria miniata]
MATGYRRFENDEANFGTAVSNQTSYPPSQQFNAPPPPANGPYAPSYPSACLPMGQVNGPPPPYFVGPQGGTPVICSQPGPLYVAVAPTQTVVHVTPVHIRNYMGLAFIALKCFFPVGIAAMVMSCMVRQRYEAGDIEGAQCASKSVLILSLISVVCGIVTALILVLIFTAR